MVQPPLEPPPRWGSSLVGKRGKFFVFGGAAGPSGGGGLALDDVWELDVARGTFRGPLDSPANKEREENRGATAGDANLGFDDDLPLQAPAWRWGRQGLAECRGEGVVGGRCCLLLKYGFTSDSCLQCKASVLRPRTAAGAAAATTSPRDAPRRRPCGATSGSWCSRLPLEQGVRAGGAEWVGVVGEPEREAAYGEQYVVKSGAGAFGNVASQNGGYFLGCTARAPRSRAPSTWG